MTMQPLASRVVCAAAFAAAVTVLHAQNAAVTITVDAGANRRAINPAIYGVAYATTAQLQDLNAPLHRYGGNNTSRYNWQLNADNRGADWYFESIAESSATPGQRGDDFVAQQPGGQCRADGHRPDHRVRRQGRVQPLEARELRQPRLRRAGRLRLAVVSAGLQRHEGRTTGRRQQSPRCQRAEQHGAAGRRGSSHFVQRFGSAAAGGLKYYILDNEHSIWHSTHRDVRPTGATMEQVRDAMIAYSGAIKNVDPGALVVGPEEWGWSGYIFSGYDQQYGSQHGWSFLPDRAAHGGMDYLPWLLQRAEDAIRHSTSAASIDAFTVHYYPQGGEFWPDGDVSSAMQLRRNRSTRSLWDPAYTDETWINDKVQLIPRLRSWVNTYYYPDTPIGITEYNWGAENHINGATTQADIYGIFGREGLDLGARWTTPATTTPTYKAMKMYRNYDGEPLDVRRHERAGDVDGQCRQPVGVRRAAVRATAR